MANEQIVLDVKLDAGKVQSEFQKLQVNIANLRQEQSFLKREIKEGRDVNGEYAQRLIEVSNDLKEAQKESKGYSAQIKLLNADTKTYNDTLNGQRQKLADMQRAYDQLSEEQRNTEGGKAFLESIKAQHDAVLGLEGATGRMQRNVGNYPQAFQAVAPVLNKVEGVLKSVGVSMEDVASKGTKAFSAISKSAVQMGKAFFAPPLGVLIAILGAILLAVQKVSEAFKKNDQAMTNLQKAFSAFQPIMDLVAKAFDLLALGISKVILGISELVTGVLGSLIPAYGEAAKAAAELVQAQDDLEQAERDYTVNSAKRNKDIARLREEATTTADLDARAEKIQEAIELEKQNLEDNKKIKAEQLRILEETARRESDTSDETANKIAQARAALYQAEESYYIGVRKLEKELTAAQRARANEEAKAAKEAEERRKKAVADRAKELEQQRKEEAKNAEERLKNAEQIQREEEDFLLSLIEDEGAKKLAQRELQGKREIEALQKRLDTEKNLTEASRQQLSDLIEAKQIQLDEELDKMAEEEAQKKTDEEVQREQEKAMRILELRKELADADSEESLQIQQEIFDAQLAQELANVELSEEEKLLIMQTYTKRKEDLNAAYWEKVKKTAEDARKAYATTMKNQAKAVGEAFDSMNAMVSAFGAHSQEAAMAQLAIALGKIAIDTGVAIAEGVATASAAGPFPANLAAIATTVATILANIATATQTVKQARSQISGGSAGKFEQGGVVGGTSYSGDKLTAQVNSGEGIYNPKQANNLLFEIANNPVRGGFDYELQAATIANAVRELPPPVMTYAEFKEFEGNVATYDELASI